MAHAYYKRQDMGRTMATKLPTDLLSTRDVTYMFDRTPMQVWRWRQHQGMPFYHIPGTGKTPAVRFSLHEIVKWAEENDVMIDRHPDLTPAGEISWGDSLASVMRG